MLYASEIALTPVAGGNCWLLAAAIGFGMDAFIRHITYTLD